MRNKCPFFWGYLSHGFVIDRDYVSSGRSGDWSKLRDVVSYGSLFLMLVEEFSDAAMKEALQRLLSMFARKVAETYAIPVDSIMAMVDEFIAALPSDIKQCLMKEDDAA